MKFNKLALCIPAFNASNYLPRLLKSALEQTVPFDEILVYDDCSTDETSNIACTYGVRVIKGDVNKGCSYGKNILAELTKCNWIHFHDADDDLYPCFVETAKKWIKKDSPPDVVLFGYHWIDYETKKLICTRIFDSRELAKDPIYYTIKEQINPFCGLYKRDSFIKAGGCDLDPNVLYNEDVAMHCQLARYGLSFDADDTITVINYRHNNSMSSINQLKCAQSHYYVLEKAAKLTSKKYHSLISEKLWNNTGVLPAYRDWYTADKAVKLAIDLGGRFNIHGSYIFKLLCMINPYFAIRLREILIRIFKPHLRLGYPKFKIN